MGVSSDSLYNGTQQECIHRIVYWDAANAATKHLTQDAHFKIVHKTRSSKNKNQQAIGYEYIHTVVNGHQVTIKCAVGVHRELRDQCITTCNGNRTWSSKVFLCTVHEIEHHDVVTSGIFGDEFCDKYPQE